MPHARRSALALLVFLPACHDIPTAAEPAAVALPALAAGAAPSVAEGAATPEAPDAFVQLSGLREGGTCGLRVDGRITCWGPDFDGRAPALVTASAGTFVQVSAGYQHGCGLRSDGVAQCWGANDFGQAPPTRAAAAGQFTRLSAGQWTTCGLRDDGTVDCWGNILNVNGWAAGTGVFTEVSTGPDYACALRTDGAVECAGPDWDTGAAPALKEAAAGGFVALAAGMSHACALRSDGAVECWGYNGEGQAPALKEAGSGRFVAVASGIYHSCGLRSDRQVECWGWNIWGQAPGLVSPSGRPVSVTVSYTHSCVLRSTGIAECWGDNGNGWATTPQQRPLAPTAPTAALSGGGAEVVFSWTDASDNETRFRIQRRQADEGGSTWGSWVPMAEAEAGATQVTDVDVETDNRYRYRVRSCGLMGCSAWATSDVVVTGTAPAAPATFTHAVQGGGVALEWEDVTAARTWQLHARSYDAGTSSWSGWAALATVTAPDRSYLHAVTTGTWGYRVRACNPAGCSAWVTIRRVALDP